MLLFILFLGWIDYSFARAHEALQTVSDSELLPPLSQLASQYHAGKFGDEHIAQAIAELSSTDEPVDDSYDRLVRTLKACVAYDGTQANEWAPQSLPSAHICPVSIDLDSRFGTDWTDTINRKSDDSAETTLTRGKRPG